jgi:hypothetical protein
MYVPISGTLKTQILDHCKKIGAKELEAATEPYKIDPAPQWMIDLAVHSVWGKHIRLKNQLPKDWLSTMDRDMQVKITYPEGGFSNHTFDARGKFDLPPNHNGWNVCQKPIEVTLDQVPVELHQRLRDRRRVRVAIKERYKALETQIGNLLDNVRSLNDAVARFPDLRLFVPNEYLERLDRKPPPRARQGVAPEGMTVAVDTELLTMAGVVGKLHKL